MSVFASPFDGLSDASRVAFYRSALAALRFVEQRRATGRRFGGEADARWRSLRGDLTASERVDLLLRDADAEWPGAFSARVAFAIRAVAEDEPFGAGWGSLEPVDAEEIWHEVVASAPPVGIDGVVAAWCDAWKVRLMPTELPALQATDRLLLCGPGAVAAALDAFASGRELDWADQVVCVATPPAHRQLASLAVALLNLPRASVVLSADEKIPGLPRRVVISGDAHHNDARRGHEVLDGAGA